MKVIATLCKAEQSLIIDEFTYRVIKGSGIAMMLNQHKCILS
jgi:hypothetical protein